MDVTFVENTENDVDSDYRREDQPWLIFRCSLEGQRCSLERSLNAQRHPDLFLRLFDCFCGCSERDARRQIERDRH